ncbi:MAG: hypothetical protein VYC34_01040, partial [Planctomycetota bacterium]|nr:hypothetical protein [Planctomycetota bacterium]
MQPHTDINPEIPAEFVHQYEQERARRLRRRVAIYCIVALALLVSSLVGSAFEYAEFGALLPGSGIELAADFIHIAIFTTALVLVLRIPFDRRGVVNLITALIIASGAVAIFSTPYFGVAWANPDPDITPRDANMLRGALALTAMWLLHFIASTLVALSPREALRALVPLLIFYALMVLTILDLPLIDRLKLVAVSPLVGAPGFA